MEETKVQQLCDTLGKLKKSAGLGISSSYNFGNRNNNDAIASSSTKVRSDGLPNNALYANFVREGTYDPNDPDRANPYGDGRVIKRNFDDCVSVSDDNSSDNDERSRKHKKKQKKAEKKAKKKEEKRIKKQLKKDAKRKAKAEMRFQLKEQEEMKTPEKKIVHVANMNDDNGSTSEDNKDEQNKSPTRSEEFVEIANVNGKASNDKKKKKKKKDKQKDLQEQGVTNIEESRNKLKEPESVSRKNSKDESKKKKKRKRREKGKKLRWLLLILKMM